MATHEQEGPDGGERASQDEILQSPTADAAPIAGGSMRSLTPTAAAEMVCRRPDQRDGILAQLHQGMGAAFVRQVIAAVDTLVARSSQAGGSAASSTPLTAASAAASSSWNLPAVVRVTATDGLRVRRTPDATTRGNVLGGLAPRQEIEALAVDGEWLRVSYRAAPAFIHGGFVELAPTQDHAASAEQRGQRPEPEPRVAIEPSSSSSGNTGGGTGTQSPEPAPQRPAATDTQSHEPNTEFITASGNAVAKTTPKEAEVLNRVRREPRRFDPQWLASAQRALGVIDATGAFNTETLRAIRARSGNAALDVAGIMDEQFLSSLAPGTPFHEETELGTPDRRQAPAAGATSPKDRTVQDLGYASYAAYRESWGDDPVTFLGNDFRTPAHPYLRARLQVAEAYVRNRVTSPDGRRLDDAGIMRAIGWNGAGNASYAHDPRNPATHQHAMGLAIDIEPGQNPYFFDHSGTNADFWVTYFEHLFQHATRLYGGEPLTAATMHQWSKQSSTEELFQRVKASSNAFAQMLVLSSRARGDESATGEIATGLARIGYTGTALETAVHEVAVADHHFHQQSGRRNARAATNLTQEMVIALRDVAGLAWGGTEMSSIENGDFMHFDCRLTGFGNSVYQAGRRHLRR